MLEPFTPTLHPSIFSSKYCALPESNSGGGGGGVSTLWLRKVLLGSGKKELLYEFLNNCLPSNGDSKILKVSYLESHVNFILLLGEKLL